MILNSLKIIYKNKNIFIIQLHGYHNKSKNGIYCLGDDKNELFFAFECLNDAKKIISETGIKYEKEIETCINVDNIIDWVRACETKILNPNELMDFNSMIISYILYEYDGVLPKEFLDFDNDSFGKALKIFLNFDFSRQYSDLKQFGLEKEVKAILESEVIKMFDSLEMKKNYQILLNFFVTHIKIIKN